MNAVTPTIPNHAETLIDAVSDRLKGIAAIVTMLREQEKTQDAYVLMVLEGADR